MHNEKIQEIKEALQVTKKWYHKIPYIGKKIYTKQKWRKYEKIKPKLFSIICEEVDKELEKNKPNEDFFNQFADINNVSLGDAKQFTVKNTNLDKYENICKEIRL